MGRQVDVREGGGGHQERVHGRADVVTEAGQGELRGAAAPAGLVAPPRRRRRPSRLRASVSAATRPFGPAPTTMASGFLTGRSQCQRRSLRGTDDRHGALGEAAHGAIDLGVGAFGSMVEQRDAAGAGDGCPARPRTRPRHDRRIPPRPPPRPGGGSRGSGDRRRCASSRTASWYSPIPSRPVAERRRAVVRDVRDGRMAVAHPEPQGAPALVRTSLATTVNPSASKAPLGTVPKLHSPRRAGGVRWGRRAATSCGPAALRRRCPRPPPAGAAAPAHPRDRRCRRTAPPARDPSAGGSGGWCPGTADRRGTRGAGAGRCLRRAAVSAGRRPDRRRATARRTRCARRSGRNRGPVRASTP